MSTDEQKNEQVASTDQTSTEQSYVVSTGTVEPVIEVDIAASEKNKIIQAAKEQGGEEKKRINKELKEKQRQLDISNTAAETKALNKSNYGGVKDSKPYVFIVRNKRSGKISQVNAVSSVEAASFLGWRPRHTQVISKSERQPKSENVTANISQGGGSGLL